MANLPALLNVFIIVRVFHPHPTTPPSASVRLGMISPPPNTTTKFQYVVLVYIAELCVTIYHGIILPLLPWVLIYI